MSSIVIYVEGNVDKETDNLNFIPIRLAVIEEIIFEPKTDLYHVYFKLGAFVKMKENIESFVSKAFQCHVTQGVYQLQIWYDLLWYIYHYLLGFIFYLVPLRSLHYFELNEVSKVQEK